MSAIGEWKRDIITPLLAFAVFHALTRSVKDLLIWMAALLAGLVLLTILIQVEPFHPLDGNIQTRYGGVGALSTWLVILAALLPMAWHVLSRQAGAWRPVLVFVSVLLLYCAYLTGNRIIWLCFSLMLVAFAAAATRARYPHRLGRYLALALGLAGVALCVMLALSSSHFRFDTEAARADILATASQDPRPRIWRESIDVLKQNAFPGLGYGIDGLKPRLMSRFQDRALAERYGHGHNLMLNYGLQMGVIGITVIVILFAGLAWTFASLGGNGSTGRVAALCGLLMLIGFLTRNMTDDFFHRHSAVLFWAVTGMLLGVTRDDRD
jgi:O-antigen ligase